VYGKTKLIGEACNFLFEKNHTVCRLPLLYGKFNTEQIIYKLIKKVQSGETIKVSNDVYSTPTNTADIMKFIEKWLVDKNQYLGKIIHLTSDKLVNLCELISFAKKELSLKGVINEVPDNYFFKLEKKPLYGGLNSNQVEQFPFQESFLSYLELFRSPGKSEL
jgi:dTDP-4-dehydrorhamnose reductase